MAVVCPNCRQPLRFKGSRPGRFTPRCPGCSSRFALTVPAGVGKPPVVEVLGRSDPPPVAPSTLGGYQLVRRLGQGGMGTVFLARQLSLKRDVALKVLGPELVKEPRALKRFLREARSFARLVHHHIVQIYDIGSERGMHYFSMELVRGQTLTELVHAQGRLAPVTAVNYVLQAARGLHYAHSRGLIHRDVKPDNLLLNYHGIIKVADLGLAKVMDGIDEGGDPALDEVGPAVTRLGTGLGTPGYIAPEQARNAAEVDARADQYSLGCTFYFLLTGQPPFDAPTGMEVIAKHLHEPPLPPPELVPEVSAELSRVVLRMLAKEPQDRFVDLGQVIRALEPFLFGRSSHVVVPIPAEEATSSLEDTAVWIARPEGLPTPGNGTSPSGTA